MDEEYILDLFTELGGESRFGKFDNFKKSISTNPSYQQDFYEVIGGNTLGDFKNFKALVSATPTQQQPVQQQPVQQQPVQQPAKKKEPTVSSSEDGSLDWFKPKQQPKQEYKPTTPIPGTDYIVPEKGMGVIAGEETDPYGFKKMEQQMFGEGGTAMPKSDYFAQVQKEEKRQAKVGYESAVLAEETKKRKQQEQTEIDKKLSENLAIKQSPEFTSSLNKIDQSIYTQPDYINDLNREYQKYGITITKGGWFGDRLIARTDDGKKMIELDTYVGDPNARAKDIESLKKFVSENAKITKEEDFLSQALRAQNMRKTARINDDGTLSTVKFISFDNKVIPTLFPKKDGWFGDYSSDKKDWIELPFDEALKEATKRGEVFTFKTNEEAEAFAKGAWKDISKLDIEGDRFYRSKGRDYITEKRRWERYDEIDDIINFYEGDQADLAKFKEQNPALFINGMFRSDIDQYIGELKKERETLRPLVKDMTFFNQEGTSEKSRMDFDAHLADMQSKASSEAATILRDAKAKVAQSNQESMEIFGVPIDKLTEDKEARLKNPQAYVKAVSEYTNALQLGQLASIKYTEAQTYFDAKINKEINNKLTENAEAVYNSWNDGIKTGLIGDQLLALTLPGYTATSGFSSKEDAARYIAEKLSGMSQSQSRVMTRLESAKTARDWWDVMLDDPFEGMALAVAGSISQMLPYGTKITAATTATGAAGGATLGLIGGPLAPVTVTGGAISGGLLGFRTGQAVTGFATEYTTAIMDAVKNNGYNPLDPKSLEAALNDQDVWDEGARVGMARGIPIAIVDYLTAGLAGNIFKPSKLASAPVKITRGIAENVVIDPLMESGGEFAAQVSEIVSGTGRKELSWSEIALEGIGSMGTNTPNFIVNTYLNTKENTDIDLAYSLTNARNVAKEKVSDERISTWANNMLRLGKIDESVNQRIQENVGLRRTAKEVLSVGEKKGKASPDVTARTMELLSAKDQLSATKNRQEVYGQEIRSINEELAAIGKSKQLLPKDQQVNLEGLVELVPEAERAAVGEYMIDGIRYTKQQFLERLNSLKPERFTRAKIAIKGDPEASQLLKEKTNAIQKQTAGEVSVQPEAGAGQEVEIGGPEAKPKITPEEGKRKEDLLKALEATTENIVVIGDEMLDRKDAQAELEAITQKEQAPVTEQAGMEQAPAQLTPEERKSKEEDIEQRRQEELEQYKDNLEDAWAAGSKETIGERINAKYDAELAALQPTEGLGAQLETLAKEEQAVTEEVAVTEEQKTPEQEADLLEELLIGKKKEPVVEEEAKPEIPKAEEVAETDIEIKDTQTTPEEVQQQIEAFDEEALPEEEKPKPGTVAELAIEDINADPERFQYKEVTDKEAGVTEQFKGKMPFRKELAGVISVWVDPADGKTYVINGHHRLEFARRSGENTMNVIYIDAKNASEARLKGAMQNIAEGMGTDMDAAKVFRETGMTVEQVQESGINVKGAKAMNGLSLASLSDNLFNLVMQGKLSQTVGVIIGSTIKNKDVQEQFYNVIKGKNLNNATIKVMAEDIQAAPTENVEQMDLFGVSATEQAAYQQRASFIAGIRSIVSKAKNILGKAAKSASFLEEYGNEIDVATTETGSRESAMALAVFDKLRNTSPEIRALIDKGVERIKNGENKNKVLNETAKQIIEATPRILEGVTGQPVAGRGEVKEPGTKGKQGVKGKKLADAVRKNLKIKGSGGLQSNILGIPVAIWNAGVETMAKAIEVGAVVNDAVRKGIEYIREKHGKKFNEAAVEKKLLIGHYKGAIEIAREAKVTNEGLKTYLKRQGLTDAQIEPLLKIKEKTEKKPISKEKAIGKPAPKKVTVNEMTALKDQLRLEAKAAREAKGDLNTKRKMLAEAIKNLEKKGRITTRQATALINKVNSVNLDNPVMVERLLDYADKVFNDAEYADKLRQAKKLQSTAKSLSKNKEKNPEVRELAKKFAEIDPALIENIDEYIEYASQVVEGVKGSKLTAKGVSLAAAVDINETSKYVEKALEQQAEKQKQMMADKMQSLMGVDVSDLTYDQLLQLLDDSSKPIDKYKETIIRDIINKMFDTYSGIIESMLETGKDPFDISEDAETIEFKDSKKEVVRNFMSIDLNSLSPREALKAVDALNNFIVNGSTANMETVYNTYIANKNASTVKKKGVKGRKLTFFFVPSLGRILLDEFASLPLLLESMFKSTNVALYFSRMSGLSNLMNGAARATTITQKTISRYLQEFSKLKPNGKAFNDAYNATERGMIAFMSRNIIGSEAAMKKEFNDRKSLVEKSIDELSKGTEKEKEKAKLYQEAYDKILKDSKNAQEVREKAAKENVNAVDWWTNEWSKHFDELSDVSLNVYNKVLDRDLNYTTDRYSKLELGPRDESVLDSNASAYHFNNGTMYKKEAGALKETTDKTGELPKNKDGEVTRYVDLSFDSIQASSLYDAMADIKTAGAIRQVEEFFKSADTRSLFSAEDFKLLTDRINLAIRNIRNQQSYDNVEIEKLVKALDKFAKYSASIALAGVTQPFKQTIPLMFNTLINAGQFDPFGVTFNKAINEFIDESGRAIANRGVESQVYIESINRLIDEAAKSKGEAALKLIEQANDLWMKVFLANPDKYIARASWMAYYEQSLKKQGLYNTTKKVTLPSGETVEILTKGIDYADHKLNEEAADYAQMMVDRQQNITDTKLAGRMYSDTKGGWGKKVLTRMLLPLASFRLNQFIRAKSDTATLFSKTTTLQDKTKAARSLSGMAVEMLVFKSMVIGFGLTYHYISDAILAAITGDEEDEEESEKKWKVRFNNLVKGQATSAVTDLFSPIPILDPLVKYGANTALDITQDFLNVADEDKFELFIDDPKKVKTYADAAGMYGIALDKINEIFKTSSLAITGKFKDDYGNEKYISEEQRKLLSWSLIPSVVFNAGLLPGAPEFNNITGKITKDIKYSAMTEKQLEVYKETGMTKEEVKADKEEWKAYKEDVLNGFKSEKQFKERDHEGYMRAIKDGSIYEYRERERKREEEKNKDEPFRGLSEKKFKELYFNEWKKFYGPGTAYFKSQRTPEALKRKAAEKRKEAEIEREQKKAEVKRKIEEAKRKAAQRRSEY